MINMCFDFGHGGSDSGASYKGRFEKIDTLKLGMAVAKEVRRHGVKVDETRTADKTMSLSARSSFERRKNYDYFISFHRNAFKPEAASGVETFTFTRQTAKARSLATKIQKNLVAVGFKDRGVKKANFHVLRETRSPAVLIEVGFIDNSRDNKIFDSKFNEIVKAITRAILDEVGVKYKENIRPAPSKPKGGTTYYRVMAGSYKNRKNAEAQISKLKKAGFESTIMIYKP